MKKLHWKKERKFKNIPLKIKYLKIRNVVKHKTGLLRLGILKTKIYLKKSHFTRFRTEEIEYRLKKALQIIYKYHVNNKRILFVGTSFYTFLKVKQLLKSTQHILIPDYLWINGILTNKSACFEDLSVNRDSNNTKVPKHLSQLKYKNDLIVVLNTFSDLTVLNEGSFSRTPIISLNSNLNILDDRSTYKIPGNFDFLQKQASDNFFHSILSSTLKKAEKNKLDIRKHRLKFYQKKSPIIRRQLAFSQFFYKKR